MTAAEIPANGFSEPLPIVPVRQPREELTTGLGHRTRKRLFKERFLRREMRIEAARGEALGFHHPVDANAVVATKFEEPRPSGDQTVTSPLFVLGIVAHDTIILRP
jgi:hypothetical protein